MALLIWLDTRHHQRLRRGRLFACYVLAYTTGRAWIEALRIDHANHFLGLRLNDYVSLLLFTGALVYLITSRRPRGGDDAPYPPGRDQKDALPSAADDASGRERV